eukprot:TRINITY_DN10844_c0_g1_i1.p1 TRINITY_DN10844_c0_g1~~TRINITY_DN10844_c0_g1_i1.p1  ORF type:complete len:101 (+),score=9.04 TRINITY_DN10844_c0_g1_i1:125-427(+)
MKVCKMNSSIEAYESIRKYKPCYFHWGCSCSRSNSSFLFKLDLSALLIVGRGGGFDPKAAAKSIDTGIFLLWLVVSPMFLTSVTVPSAFSTRYAFTSSPS